MNILVEKKTFKALCFGHVFSKACQYGIAEENVYKDLKYVSIKFVHVNLQKCIIWLKKFRKIRHEWNKACVETNICPKKLSTLMKTR
jgi:hypothetical protein